MTKLIEEEIQPILVPAVLEHEGIGGISTGDQSGGGAKTPTVPRSSGANSMEAPTQIDPFEALDKLLRMLTRFHAILSKHGVDPEIIAQIFKQVFYFVCAGALNNLLLRKDMCHWSRGMQIRYNPHTANDARTFKDVANYSAVLISGSKKRYCLVQMSSDRVLAFLYYRYNVAQLEQWARDQKVHDEQTRVIDALAPIVQASQLLQVTTQTCMLLLRS